MVNSFIFFTMKKAILSPLCSALVIPGLGQIINQHLKKGLYILSAVFILFIVGIFKLYLMIQNTLKGVNLSPSDLGIVADKLRSENYTVLSCILAAFGLLWLYSVVDAYLTGKKIDRQGEGNSL